MSVFPTIQRFASDWAAARRLAQTEHFISALPSDIRKDIGWPDAQPRLRRPGGAEPSHM